MSSSLFQRAYLAMESDDWKLADALWEAGRATEPHLPDGWLHGATALIRLGRDAEAEILLDEALKRFSDNPNVLLFIAFHAKQRQDWATADRLFAAVRMADPGIVDGWLQGAISLTRMGLTVAAEALLHEVRARRPEDPNVLLVCAHGAFERSDWACADRDFARVRALRPELLEAWPLGVQALRRLGRVDAAATLLAEALERFPNESVLTSLAGHDAPRRSRETPDERPAAIPEPALDPAEAHAATRRELLLRFQGLGHGCAFGAVQRALGAEPLGLFRWASIRGSDLIASIRAGLPDFESPDDARLIRAHEQAEYGLELPASRFLMHIHGSQSEEPGRLLLTLKRRVRRLRDRFIANMQAGDQIFVRQAEGSHMPRAEMIALHDALLMHGKARLLCVCAEDGPRAGKVERIREGLAVGYLKSFRHDQTVDPASLEMWVALCARSVEIFEAEALLARVTVR